MWISGRACAGLNEPGMGMFCPPGGAMFAGPLKAEGMTPGMLGTCACAPPPAGAASSLRVRG